MSPTYSLVIPAKNEQINLPHTLDAVVRQTIRPTVCLVVDDGSDDSTVKIADSFSAKYSFFKVVAHSGKKEYSLGGHVVEVFEFGRNYLSELAIQTDYVVKLDADLSFPADFMQKIFEKIKDDKWGIVSGTPYRIEGNSRILEYSPQWHSQGQFKVYNTEFLKEVGCLPKSLGWDCADNIKAIKLGWKTAAFRDIHYKMYRPVGGKFSLTQGRIKHGKGCYLLGYSPLYFLLRVTHDLFKPPVVKGSISMLKGYFDAMRSNQVKILDRSEQKLLRKLFWLSLYGRFSRGEFELLQKVRSTS